MRILGPLPRDRSWRRDEWSLPVQWAIPRQSTLRQSTLRQSTRWHAGTRLFALGVTLVLFTLSACGSTPPNGPPGPDGANTSGPTGATRSTGPTGGSGLGSFDDSVSSTSLPLGDGRVSLTAQVSYIMLCTLATNGGGGGAGVDGPWIDTSAGTWNPTQKVAVQGNVMWPNAALSITASGSTRTITTNDLPKGEPTGNFPISTSDPAYQYDRNPNHLAAQSLTYALPANPTIASQPTCLHGGPIGVTLDGVVLFDALDAQNRDGVAHEIQDQCGGHPQQDSMYHYHSISPCLLKNATGSSILVGYALDGFGIYVERDADGNLPKDRDLDACHGRTSTVEWDGREVSMYHYDATAEYPYTIGCFKGAPITTGNASGPGGVGNPAP